MCVAGEEERERGREEGELVSRGMNPLKPGDLPEACSHCCPLTARGGVIIISVFRCDEKTEALIG